MEWSFQESKWYSCSVIIRRWVIFCSYKLNFLIYWKWKFLEKVNFVTGQEGRCVGTTGTLSGVEGLEEHGLCLEDGPAGVRPVHGVSQFSSGQALAATWDRDLIERVQKAKGQEFFDQGVHIHLGPVSSGPIGRSPLGGRNWEGSSPDPYLNGAFTYHAVRGVQDASVAAVTKHFIGYEQVSYFYFIK